MPGPLPLRSTLALWLAGRGGTSWPPAAPTRGEQLGRIEALRVGGERVEHRGRLGQPVALSKEGGERHRGFHGVGVDRQVLLQRRDGGGEGGLEDPVALRQLGERRRAGSSGLRNGLAAGGGVPREELLVGRGELPPAGPTRL